MDNSIALGIAISIIDAAIFIPQAVRAYKFRNDPEALKGISTTTMWFVLTAYIAWFFWDLRTGRWDAHAYIYAGIPAAIFILIIVYRSQIAQKKSRKNISENK